MGERIRLCATADVPAGAARRFDVGEHRIALIRVDDKHPFISPWDVFQSPILFAWKAAVPTKLHNSRSKWGCDFRSSIRAL